MSQVTHFPASTLTLTAESATGAAVPSQAVMVGGDDGTNLQALSVNSSGQLNINNISGTVSLPTGAATAAKQPALGTAGSASSDVITVQGIASMTALVVDGSASVQPVSQSGTWNINDISGTISLPTGAATAAKQPALGTAGSASSDVITVQGIASMTALVVDGSGVTQPVSGTVAATQSGTWNINDISGTVSLPTGAATAAKQPALGTAGSASSDVITVQGIASMTALIVDQQGRSKANAPAYNDYSSTSVTTSAYVELVASLSSACKEVEIFDSSGQGMILAVGAAASEVDQIYIFPGGNGRVPLAIAASSRVSIKAKTATASTGYIMVNFYT